MKSFPPPKWTGTEGQYSGCLILGSTHKAVAVGDFPGGSVIRKPPAKQETWVRSLVRKMPWRSTWQPTPVFSPGRPHGQKGLEGYRPWGPKRAGLNLVTKQSPWGSYVTFNCSFFFFFSFFSSSAKEMGACILSPLTCIWLCDPMDCSPPGSSVHGILWARILEWAAMPSSRGSSPPRNWTRVSCGSCIAGGFFITEPSRKPLKGQWLLIFNPQDHQAK